MITRSTPDKKALDSLPLTISMTLTVSQWSEVRGQLANKWPACDVATAIFDAIHKIEQALSTYENKETK
jgi:hypothetical protein